MKTTIISKKWEVAHTARYGAPAGVDEMYAEISVKTVCGREYLTETVYQNNVIKTASEYPANTTYAAKRLALYA